MKGLCFSPVWHQKIKKFALSLLLVLVILNTLTVVAASYESYVGNKSTKVYHIPTCTYAEKVSAANRVYFTSRQEAEWSGYRRCHYCGDDVVQSGQNNGSSENSSNKTPKPNTSTNTPSSSDRPDSSHSSWWDYIIDEYAIFVYSFPFLLVAIGLYFLHIHTSNSILSSILLVCLIIAGLAALPAAFLVGTIIMVLGGIIGCISICISKLLPRKQKK